MVVLFNDDDHTLKLLVKGSSVESYNVRIEWGGFNAYLAFLIF